ncbi:MAG: deoxyribose-phosphate aldolase [Pleomorphochaeta sp.]
MDIKNINKFIDHTLLAANASTKKIITLCEEAKQYNFASVCVNSCHVFECANLLKETNVKVCTVVGFPLGAMSSKAKAFEAKQAIEDGAQEIDMVINIGWLKDGKESLVLQDIQEVKKSCGKILLKVIIETCLLTDDEKIKACKIAKAAGADFVKTSTGFSTAGAKIDDIKLMRTTVGNELGVKASGGIHSYEEAKAMIDAGATRIGASCGVAIVTGAISKSNY